MQNRINYRALSDAELCEIAEDRVAAVKRMLPSGGPLWEEVLYRLQRSCGTTNKEDCKKGERTGTMITGRLF